MDGFGNMGFGMCGMGDSGLSEIIVSRKEFCHE